MNGVFNGRDRSDRQKEITKALGRRLREARLSMEPAMSQGAVGEALGVSFQMVQKYEKGECQMTPAQVVLAAEVLGLPVDFLLLGFSETYDRQKRLPLSDSQLKDGLLRRQQRMDMVVGGVEARAARQVLVAWLALVRL